MSSRCSRPTATDSARDEVNAASPGAAARRFPGRRPTRPGRPCRGRRVSAEVASFHVSCEASEVDTADVSNSGLPDRHSGTDPQKEVGDEVRAAVRLCEPGVGRRLRGAAEGDLRRDQQWWGKHAQAGTILDGARLQDTTTATTVRLRGGEPVVTDGPFIEAKEILGGYGVIDVADLDEALVLARTWPALQVEGESAEVRPVHPM